MRMTMSTGEQFQHGDQARFEAALERAFADRAAREAAPAGLEQRLLARMAQAAEMAAVPAGVARQPFAFVEIGKVRRSASSIWTAVGAHVAAMVLIAFVVAAQVHGPYVKPAHEVALMTEFTQPPPIVPRADNIGGGGGHHDPAPVTQGRLPEFARQQIVPPMQPPKLQPQLAVEPTLVMQDNLRMANNNMASIGDPNSNLKGVSLGTGSGTGIGSGNGSGLGPGSGINTGGGVFHVGGSIRKPELLISPEPEFSEEARKAKFSGNVEVYLIVDEQGNPTHVRVSRGIGMGLDEKAVEAVRQYKFKPATQNGKPVKVDLYVDVDFTIL